MSPTPVAAQPAARLCPGCARRDTMLVDPGCPICDGAGVLLLGRPIRFSPEVVAEAVEVSLEASARDAVMRDPAAVSNGAGAEALRRRVRALRAVGVLHNPDRSPAGTVKRPASPRDRAAQVRQLADITSPGVVVGDVARVGAGPVEWWLMERPTDRGGIPGFSAGGYVCALARVCDPYDPLGSDARRWVQRRDARKRDGAQLALIAEAAMDRQKVPS